MSEKKPGVGVGIWIERDGKVLLGLRVSSNPNAGGSWTFAGGKIDFGESFEEVGARELLEETGLRGKDFEVIGVTNDVYGDWHWVVVDLKPRVLEGEVENKEPHKFVEWKWFSLNELPEPLHPSTKSLIENELSKRGKKMKTIA